MPKRRYIPAATSEELRAICGVRAEMMRCTSSAASTDPHSGTAHASMLARSGVSGPPKSRSRSAGICRSGSSPVSASTTQKSTASPIISAIPCTRSVHASASIPPNAVYAITMAAARVIISVASTPDAALSTWPKARICAAAHSSEVGTISTTASRSTPGEKRWPNRSASVVSWRRQSGTAKTSPITRRHAA